MEVIGDYNNRQKCIRKNRKDLSAQSSTSHQKKKNISSTTSHPLKVSNKKRANKVKRTYDRQLIIVCESIDFTDEEWDEIYWTEIYEEGYDSDY